MVEGAPLKTRADKPPPPQLAVKMLSPIFQSFARRKEKQSHVPAEKRTLRTSLTGPDFHRSMLTELGVLYGREITNVVRNPALLALHLFVSLLMALLVGGVFQNVKDDISGIQNRQGAFLFSVAFFSLASLSALEAFITERIIFTQEGSGKYYRTISYFLPKITLDALFLRILPAVVYSCIMYWLMGLRPDGAKFLLFLIIMVMVAMTAGEVCSCISLITASVGVANFLSIVVMLLMILFTGALVNSDKITPGLQWLLKLSFLNYAFEVLMTSQVEGLTILFQPSGFPKPVPVKGEVVLDTLGQHSERRTADTWALLAMVVGYLLLAWLLLMLRVCMASRLKVHKDRAPPPAVAPPVESAGDV
ncbi:ATP-binding cassette subfamily G (WHITE) member 2 [Klebsormidium nitens]|uniref:ATP-binding cassette subfamily G (WHITE) member 2 n=1 Tax=Klebsormidium nitens TaxID=105231 RepID=A0A1Y1HRW7_KLENI|nr:ATP-binding cassette subfamily G (WHITE) member 2 [Klebsormidium nitens]|eukprot:GAQ81374.1 ATP-binding cassette subfamily G (WHITE) member 2 [Klebsormidium nitens]